MSDFPTATVPQAPPIARRPLSRAPLAVALITALTLLTHIWCVWDGSVLDDHWHQRGLRQDGWSLPELLRTLTIDTRDFLDMWWQDKPIRWEYARPAFILAMKTVYHVIGNDDPAYLHGYSILLHWIGALLTWRLCWWLTRRPGWSILGGLIFVVYPHSIISVAWPSAQNCVQQTTLLLAALLCYLRASRLRSPAEAPIANIAIPAAAPAAHARPMIAMFVFWLLALFTRENAILFPLILAAFDFSFGGRTHLWGRRNVYSAMLTIGIAFAVWRIATVQVGMPDVYMRRPDGDPVGYFTWAIAKLLHYIATSIWFAPMTIGPTGRFDPWREALGDCLIMIGVIAVLWGGYVAACRRVAGWWIWPLWIILAVLPVVPVIATPHSGYMCAVGVAVGLVIGAAYGYRSPTGVATHFPARLNRAWAWLYFAGACFFCLLNRWQWTATIAAERHLQEWVIADPPAATVRDAYFINLPFVNVYTKPALDRRLGSAFEPVRCHVLTWAPQPAMVEELTIVEQIDDYSFAVQMIAGQSYFSRLVGRFVLEGGRAAGGFAVGERVRTADLEADIVEMDAEGVRRIVFRFPRPLVDPAYCFYVTTPDCGAAMLRFRCLTDAPATASVADEIPTRAQMPAVLDCADAAARLDAGAPAAADELFVLAESPDATLRDAARTKLREVAECVARATASPIQLVLDQPRLSDADWGAIRNWWRTCVGTPELATLWRRRFDFDDLIKEREELPHARVWAAKVVHTDMYLTGRPWPGPRRFARP